MEFAVKVITATVVFVLFARLFLDYIMAAFHRKKLCDAIESDRDKFIYATATFLAREILQKGVLNGEKKSKQKAGEKNC